MPASREKIIEQLTDAGLVSSEEVTQFAAGSNPENAAGEVGSGIQQLLESLVARGKITRYQADKFESDRGAEIAFGDYIVTDELGRGGMGTVLLARHRRMERTVAIKVLPGAALESESAVSRFYQEVKVAAQLNHPNIVHAYDAGEHHGFHYLVMEYVPGRDLSKVLADRGVLALDAACDYILQAAEGLSYAHRKGVVHRDIKPANMLLDDEGVVKILDMGLARIGSHADQTESLHLTTTGQVMGTVDFMAPEQAEDTRNADHRSDIYSLGCTLYRFLTGAAPFSRDTIVKTILAHREAKPPGLGFRQSNHPAGYEVEQIYLRMVAKQPADRYQSCDELIQDLRRASGKLAGQQGELTLPPQSKAQALSASNRPQTPPGAEAPTIDSQRAVGASRQANSSHAGLSSAGAEAESEVFETYIVEDAPPRVFTAGVFTAGGLPAESSSSAGPAASDSNAQLPADARQSSAGNLGVDAGLSDPASGTRSSGFLGNPAGSGLSADSLTNPEPNTKLSRSRFLMIVALVGLCTSFCLLGLPVSIYAWVLANGDLGRIERGMLDEKDAKLTRRARWLATVGIIIGALCLAGVSTEFWVNS